MTTLPLTWEETGTQETRRRLLRIAREVSEQLHRELAEERMEAFYARLRAEAAERRAKNPEAYRMPTNYTPLPCPTCGQPMPSDARVYHAHTTDEAS